MRTEASIQIRLDSEAKSKTIFKALKPETKTPTTYKSKVKTELRGNDVLLHFKAADTAALRASINSYLRWINAIQETYHTIEELK
jgi:KEOPS complex subunit Pcc1